eukprot:GAHX01003514.1.p1 GENE.GAHX01003514.1~~GAHX01003514.1.p1  ORF type:complete len:310 (+),score=51.43 GAHX01003514.1:31-960(+)
MYFIPLLGPAGVGKTTLSYSLVKEYVSQRKHVHIINLDPSTPYSTSEHAYTADYVLYDYSQIITIEDIMINDKIGPNGALIEAMNLFQSEYITDVLELLDTLSDEDIVIIDFPGQIELFWSKPIINDILNSFLSQNKNKTSHNNCDNRIVALYLLDATFITCTNYNNNKFLAAYLLALSVSYSMNFPMNFLITKSDLLPDSILEEEFNLETLYLRGPNLNMFDDLDQKNIIRINEKSKNIKEELRYDLVEMVAEQGMTDWTFVSNKKHESILEVVGLLEIDFGWHDYGEGKERVFKTAEDYINVGDKFI